MRCLAKLIFFKILKWKIAGRLDPAIQKMVIIVVPHTSWHDFYIGALVRKIIDFEIHYVAKKELFNSIFGWYFRWMGGAPIDRSKRKNTVDQVVQIFHNREKFRLTITPEGTRKKVDKWKSGFYHIAHQANAPIVPVAFDYGTKTIKIGKAFYPTGNYLQDLPKIKCFFKNVRGKAD
ncbi:MAG: 1-acyl-sn-glycerol-3-phosphate acyltransferase [Bacteroidota bacterium]